MGSYAWKIPAMSRTNQPKGEADKMRSRSHFGIDPKTAIKTTECYVLVSVKIRNPSFVRTSWSFLFQKFYSTRHTPHTHLLQVGALKEARGSMGCDDPPNNKLDERTAPVTACNPSLTEMPAASADDSNLTAAAAEEPKTFSVILH